jgi:hypothetical protein
MTYLFTHFTLDELTHSQTAARQGIDNTPDPATLERLKATAYGMELVRKELGNKPILISSGYRSAALNAAVGGSQGSQHLLGQAVDFTCPTFGTPAEIVRKLVDSDIQFDQVIVEFSRWVHISFSDRNRRHALVIDKSGARGFV